MNISAVAILPEQNQAHAVVLGVLHVRAVTFKHMEPHVLVLDERADAQKGSEEPTAMAQLAARPRSRILSHKLVQGTCHVLVLVG